MFNHIISFVSGFLFCKFLPDLKHRWLAVFMAYFSSTMDPKLLAFKRGVFEPIKDIRSKLPEYQNSNSIKILEIGAGTGTNFQFYPEGCHLVVVDQNPHFRKYYENNRANFPQIKSEEIIVAAGENMDMVVDNSVDVVVISFVLCCVNRPKQFLQQVRRVLVPGGKLFFVEHIREWDGEAHGYRMILQDILTILRLWPILFDGCELNRETLQDIESAGFSEVNAEKKYGPIDYSVFQVFNSHLIGSATK
uniref:Methyltransferase-like protein 7A n=1 Tax=Hirondellea gigas TaxID=1518452 RepID=A0A2P2I1Y4_9CRUS